MGDSVLDDFFWLQTPERPLRVKLQEALAASPDAQLKSARCVNLAVDQMTTFDFEERAPSANPWQVYAEARQKVPFADEQDRVYPVDADGVIRSVASLKQLENVSWIVLSIGGNDVYLNRNVQTSLLLSLLPPLANNRQEVAQAFGKRLRRIVTALRRGARNASFVLVIPYQPHRDFSLLMGAPINDVGERIRGDLLGDLVRGLERQYLPDVVTPMVKEILAVGRELGCPVVDLSRTFDPTCEEHYGTGRIGQVNSLGVPWSGAEPSDVSGGFVAELLAHAVSRGQKPVVYRGVPRQEGARWSLLVKEEANDAILAEDYQFGGTTGARLKAKAGDEGGGINWFGVGVLVAAAVNGVAVLQGGDPLFFDRAGLEADLQAEVVARSGADAAQTPGP